MVSPLMIYNVGLCGAAAEGLARDVGHPSFALVIQQEKKEEKKKKKRQSKQKLHRSIPAPGTTPVPFWAGLEVEVQDIG